VTAPKVITTVKSMAQANEVRLLCPHCNGPFYIQLEWPYLNMERTRKVREAIELHRKNCPSAPPEDGRVYRIDYPRA
jgi:hypothetical protein